MKEIIKRILHTLFKDYQFNRIYYVDLPNSDALSLNQMMGAETVRIIASKEQFASSQDQRIRDHAWYFDKDAFVYGIYIEDELVCICSFWIAGHPKMPSRFSTIKAHEAVMVDLLTAPEYRGMGLALAIISFAEQDLFLKGYKKLWTWIWHTNTPSIRTFKKAGWKDLYLLLEFHLYGMKNYLSFKLPVWE